MTWAIAAISVNDQIEKYGAYAGLAAIIGLGVLSLLYFAQAREVKRLREWAGRAPERAAELESRVQADATRRVSGAPLRPPAAAQAATAAGAVAAPGATAPAGAVTAPTPAATPAPAAAEGADKPAPAVAVPGLPVPVPAASGAPAAAAAAGTAVPSATSPTTTAPTPASTETPDATPAEKPAEAPAGGNGVTGTPPPVVGPRVPGRPPPTTTRPPVPAVPVPPVAAESPAADRPAAARALRGGPPSRTLPPRETASEGGHGRPSGRVLGVIGGVALVIVAVVVVLLVSTGGDDTPPAPNQVAETTAQTTGSEPARTQSSRQQRVDRADTPVAVLNGTGVNGLARQVADRLQTTGYRADADNTTARPATVVGYKPGAKPAADEIGKLLEVSSAQIQPMPAELAGIAGSHAVVVVLGADKASD